MKILRMEKFQPRNPNAGQNTGSQTGLRKTDWEVLMQHDRLAGKLNLRCEAALKDPGCVKRLLEAGMIDARGNLTPQGRQKHAELAGKNKQPETPGAEDPGLPEAGRTGAPEDRPVEKLTASDWALLMKYDRKTGNLLRYDPENNELDQTSRAILKDPSIIQRLIDNNMILPGGWLTPEAKQECVRIAEKLKNQQAADYPGPQDPLAAGSQGESQTGVEPESGKEAKKTGPEAKGDPEPGRFSDRLSKIYSSPQGGLNPNPEPSLPKGDSRLKDQPQSKKEARADAGPEPGMGSRRAELEAKADSESKRFSDKRSGPDAGSKDHPGPGEPSDAKPGTAAGMEQQSKDGQASRAYTDRQHYPDPDLNPKPVSERGTKDELLSGGEEQSKGALKPAEPSGPAPETGEGNKIPDQKDLQAFFMSLPDNPSRLAPTGNPEGLFKDGRQTKLLPAHLQHKDPEKIQKSAKSGDIPLKGPGSGETTRPVDLRAISKPEDRHAERPNRRPKDSGGGGDINEPPRFSLRDVFHIIFKRKLQILLFFSFIVCMAAAVTLLMKPVYEASAQILVKLGRESVFMPTAGNVTPILNINREDQVNSEIEIIKSRSLAEQVVTAIGPTVLYKNLAEQKSGISGLIASFNHHERTPDEIKATDFESAVAGFMKSLDVTGVKKSNVIQVSFKHQDSQMAALVVNDLANMYLDHHLAVYKTPQNVKFFQEQTDLLKNKLEQSEENLKALRKQHNITSLDEQRTLLLGQSSELNTGLNQTISLEVETEKRILQLRKQLASVPQTAQGEETDQNPYLINTLEARLVELQLKEKDLLTKYTDQSRLVQNVKEEIRVVMQKLEEQETKRYGRRTSGVNPTYQRLKEELLSNEAELEALKAKKIAQKKHLDELQDKLESLNQVELELKQLEQQVEVDQGNYRLYLSKVEESRISDAMDSEKIASVSLIGPARAPREPVSPKFLLNLLVGIILGMFGSLSLALFREYLDDRIEKIEDVEKELQLPVLASIPIFAQKAAGAGGFTG
jgi:uncharacterized protein involved in exopolysaccharide biosynthesis